jgi:hypothetical protein
VRVRAQESLPKVFALTTPMHLRAKLAWEIEGLRTAIADSESVAAHLHAAYCAFNCAVTAWHVSDWIWEYLPPAELSAQCGRGLGQVSEFQNWLIQQSRSLNCCREIANGSKHRVVSRGKPDLYVKASLVWAVDYADVNARVDEPLGRYRSQLVIHDREGSRPALDVFQEAYDYWCGFLRPWEEDRSIGLGP